MSNPTSIPTPKNPTNNPMILLASQTESRPSWRETTALMRGTVAISSPVNELEISFSATPSAPNGMHISMTAKVRMPFQCVRSERAWP
jgi:hypothetical protein